MKGYRTTRQFETYFRRRISRNAHLAQDYQDSVQAFLEDRTSVDDHALENAMQSQRAFSINDEYRVVYIERDDYFLFLNIGTHDQVYRR
jgi:mRNA-degrading endonuclease YafQ of YafQ-DinJ toxin-antitoxin module